MVGDPDNIIIPDGDYPLEDGPSRKKPKAVPVKKIAPKRSDVPRDRGSDSARRPAGAYAQARAQQSENDYRFSNGEGSEPREARASAYARHAKRDGTVYGDYPKNPTGPAIGGKHGKSWNGKD